MSMTIAVVLGTGVWGTTLAQVLADAGVTVAMWGRNTDTISFINGGENSTCLSGIILSERISATTDIAEAAGGRELVVVAVPVKVVHVTLSSARGSLSPDVVLLSLAKGPELGSLKRIDETIAEALGMSSSHIIILFGPGLSREIADRQLAITIVAAHDVKFAKEIAKVRRNSYFRPYVSIDVMGTGMTGVTKNVIAVTIGAAEGIGLGISARSTLITRSLAEMMQLGTVLGVDPAIFAGLLGIGNLVVACSSYLSRSFSSDHHMGTGTGLAEALALSPGVAEGVASVSLIPQVAASVGVDIPITGVIIEVVEGRISTEDMGRMLLAHPQKMDGWKTELV